MAWEDEIKKRTGKPVVCLEILLDQMTLNFSDIGLREDTVYWEPRICQISPLTRSIDPTNQSFQINEVSIELDNNTDKAEEKGYFENLLALNVFKNKKTNIYLKFIEEGGSVTSQLVYSGLCSPIRINESKFELKVRPKVMEKLKVMQRTIDRARFANAPDGSGAQKKFSSVGQGMNIIFGDCSASTGAIELQMIDESTGTSWSESFVVAMHRVRSVDDVWRYRSDNATKWSQRTKNTHWREFKSATDSKGDVYSYIQLAVGEWQEGDRYFASVKGFERALDNNFYENPAEQLEKLLTELEITEGVTLFEESDLDQDLWIAAESNCNERIADRQLGYATSGFSAFAIPLKSDGNRIESPDNQWALLQDIARSFNHTLFITTEGKIGITSIDLSSLNSTSTIPVTFRQKDGDFLNSPIIDLEPFERCNSVRVEFKHGHPQQNGFYNYIHADDLSSQSRFGVITDSVDYNRVARNTEMVEDVTTRDVMVTSGEPALVKWSVPGFWGLQCDIGDIVGLEHNRTIDWGDVKQIRVTGIVIDLQNKSTILSGLTVGDSLGPVKFSTQESVEIPASAVTFIGTTQTECNGNSFTDANANSSYSNRDYLMHGHHYASEVVCENYFSEWTQAGGLNPLTLGYGNINYRTLIRFQLPVATWSTRMIQRVSIQLQLTEIPNLFYNLEISGLQDGGDD